MKEFITKGLLVSGITLWILMGILIFVVKILGITVKIV